MTPSARNVAGIWTEPRLRGLELGTSAWFRAQKQILRNKPQIRASYERWYAEQKKDLASVPVAGGEVVELGSGAGFLKEVMPEAITSDVIVNGADRVIDARKLPFADSSVRGILMSHAFHHIPENRRFFAEAERVLVPGGVVSMIEVAHSPLAALVFGCMHPEPYKPDSPSWDFENTGSPYDSNQALSWIIFVRDRRRFELEFPGLKVESIRPLPWLVYLLSGGVMRRSLVPQFFARFLRHFEWLELALTPLFGLHWVVTLRKVSLK